MKRKTIKLTLTQIDLACLQYVMDNYPKTNDAGTAMTIGNASMLVSEMVKLFNAS